MIALQLGLRAWALFPSWFYSDDYRLMTQARDQGFGRAYLGEPFDGHLLPLGRAIAFLVQSSGRADWTTAASVTWTLQALASVLCLVMLVVLFGVRWGILVPLGLYLFLAVTVPASMWWAASLSQQPFQVVFFATVASWVTYLRGRSPWWLCATFVAVALGLSTYEKALLLLPVMAFVMLAYFAAGTPLARARACLSSYWPSLVLAALVAVGYLVVYAALVESPVRLPGPGVAGRLADTMLGTALPSGLTGGPWRWSADNPPVARADPPDWTVHASWVLIVLVVLWLFARRSRTLRAWALLAGYAASAYLLLFSSRVAAFGAGLGLEYRYLTDVVLVLSLCVGLATMPLRGAVESSAPRTDPLVRSHLRTPWPAVVVALVCASGIVSTVRYVAVWHDDNPGDAWAHSVMDGLRGQGEVDLADTSVPEAVMPAFAAPYNRASAIVPLLVDNARFPEASNRLTVLDGDGVPRAASVQAVAQSSRGPDDGCGWRIDGGASVRVPLDTTTFDYDWWMRIGYLASGDGPLTVVAGDDDVDARVVAGLGTLFVHVTGEVGAVTFTGLAPGTTLCVDQVQVGSLEPGGYL
ncbi:hypothetical protein [Nocardioides flavescens]|uniref:4-amino-4-deoxy-L-arabinose transferase n=1 Tax=Nocardioides flavescens TaxID=2691959 RepID=A0A6L7EMG7_9ACTN|nr:hypothetical protein [Nocardioides flavescens]MXG88537.1 hypothetical protein [Nocardioides flavescens]